VDVLPGGGVRSLTNGADPCPGSAVRIGSCLGRRTVRITGSTGLRRRAGLPGHGAIGGGMPEDGETPELPMSGGSGCRVGALGGGYLVGCRPGPFREVMEKVRPVRDPGHIGAGTMSGH
jgi:hypothetical protein